MEGKAGNSLEYDRAGAGTSRIELKFFGFFSLFRLSLLPLPFHILPCESSSRRTRPQLKESFNTQ